jgi:hypothetical protein
MGDVTPEAWAVSLDEIEVPLAGLVSMKLLSEAD